MAVEKTTTRTKKAAAAPKAEAKPIAKPAAASKATTTKRVVKAAVSEPAAPAKPKKAPAAKTTSPAAEKPAKAPATRKAAAAKPVAEVKPKAAAAKKATDAPKLVKKPAAPSEAERQQWIATAAYHRAEKRGFIPGYEAQDWLAAEAEINELIGK
ncbi:MAG: DUF2934 domain-containing protein [Parasulfuritortus sp.]|nr:DUF2934 domain-containing protein [Parasulfuritortus sp.]